MSLFTLALKLVMVALVAVGCGCRKNKGNNAQVAAIRMEERAAKARGKQLIEPTPISEIIDGAEPMPNLIIATNGYPEESLVYVRYTNRDLRPHRIDGPVTKKYWGHWRTGEEGYLHMSDFQILAQRGNFIQVKRTKDVPNRQQGGTLSLNAQQPATRIAIGQNTDTRAVQALEQAGAMKAYMEEAQYITELAKLPHIGPARAKLLIDAGYTDYMSLLKLTVEDLRELDSRLSVEQATSIIAAAQGAVLAGA